MKNFKYILAVLCAIPVFILIALGVSAVDSSGFTSVSKKTSPSGKYTVYRIDSISGEGVAPQGQHLLLTDKKLVLKLNDGQIVFAGYCEPLAYEWKSDQLITIRCRPTRPEGKHTKARKDTAFGVRVEVQYEQ